MNSVSISNDAALFNPFDRSSVPRFWQDKGLSGQVFGLLANRADFLQTLGQAVFEPPYKKPPQAPVLFAKPRNTLATSSRVSCGTGEPFCARVHLALKVGRVSHRISTSAARESIAGYVAVADLSLEETDFYRPNLRLKIQDNSCLLLSEVMTAIENIDPSKLKIELSIDGKIVQTISQSDLLFSAEQSLSRVTEFMTLYPGDLLLLGSQNNPPVVYQGQVLSAQLRQDPFSPKQESP